MKKLAPIIALVALIGCVNVGREFASYRINEIKRGETTEQQLVEWFGQPIGRGTTSAGATKMNWWQGKVGMGSYNGQLLEVILTNGVVSDFINTTNAPQKSATR